MKGAIYNGIKNIELMELPMPDCDDNGIVIKNLYAGICGSDISAYNHGGDDVFIFKGSEFGHEMISEVVKVGKNVKDVQVGQRIFPFPTYIKKDRLRASTSGGFSEYVEMEDFELNKSAVFVPDNITDRQAAIIEPFLIGCNAVRSLQVEKGKNAIVFGSGAIGITAAMTLKYLGCRVTVCDIIESRLSIARELGFETCHTINEDYFEKCKSIYGSTPTFIHEAIDVDYYVDAAGNQAIIDMFFKGAKTDAKLSVIAVHHKPVSINLVPLTYTGLNIVGVSGTYQQNISLVLEILSSHQFDVEKIITAEYKHEDIVEAFEAASDAQKNLKVIIKY